MSTQNTQQSERVVKYFRELKRYQRLQSVVSQPYFNATKEQTVFTEFEKLGVFLESEAATLWEMGIDVYH